MKNPKSSGIGPLLFDLLEAAPRHGTAQVWLDRYSVATVILGWIMAAFTSVSTLRAQTFNLLSIGIIAILILIVVEFTVRFWASGFDPCPLYSPTKERFRHSFATVNILDPICVGLCVEGLISAQPEFVTAGFTLRLFRIFRFSKADDVLWTILKRNLPALGTVLTLWAVLLMAGSGLIYAVENKAQPDKFDNIFQSLYYMLVTFTTTGYGDLYPITPWGKIIASTTMLISAGLLGGIPIGIVAGEFIAVRNEKYNSESANPENEKSLPE